MNVRAARLGLSTVACLIIGAALFAAGAAAQSSTLLAGVGRADITPPTGYYLMGWVRSDAVGNGVHTRLYARAIVLDRGGHKLALVSEDLNGIPGGVLAEAAAQLASRGFSQANILDSASHTHAAPSQFYNFSSYDTVFMTAQTPTSQNVSGSIDPQLYAFEVRGLVEAIRRADDNLGPARVGWGAERLVGLTQNRSLEAHLANYGILEAYGAGSPSQDPFGVAHTIDPEVDVLRVDKEIAPPKHGPRHRHHPFRPGGRRPAAALARVARNNPATAPRHRRPHRTRTGVRWMPVGMWSTFANHGTVNKATYLFYNGDHHATAQREVEDAIRSQGQVPAGQDVVNSFGNSDEGDVTSGIAYSGPADAQWVGDQEAQSMLAAWRQAGASMSSTLPFDIRWTRVCFCGQTVPGGPVDTMAAFGLPQLTGSEEGRGPLYDIDHVNFEDHRLPADNGPQGDKIIDTKPPALDVPNAVPLMAVRIGDRMIVSVPGEATVGVGDMLRDAVTQATKGAGITHVVIAGLVNEYLSYFTTPAEYERQHYEGGSTLYGEYSSLVVVNSDAQLAGELVSGQPAPAAYPFDPTKGLAATAAPFSTGATSATAGAQPQTTPRLGHADFAWAGGVRGFDRPADTPFITVRRRTGSGWAKVTDDLGLQVRWSVDSSGHYLAEWEVPLDAPAGTYDLDVTANHYSLTSSPFFVVPDTHLALTGARAPDGALTLMLAYPAAVYQTDFTYRPAQADGGSADVLVAGRPVSATSSGGAISVPGSAGQAVSVAAGAVRDRFGNSNAGSASF